MPTDDAMPAQRPRRVLGRGPGAVPSPAEAPAAQPLAVPSPATAPEHLTATEVGPEPGTEPTTEPTPQAAPPADPPAALAPAPAPVTSEPVTDDVSRVDLEAAPQAPMEEAPTDPGHSVSTAEPPPRGNVSAPAERGRPPAPEPVSSADPRRRARTEDSRDRDRPPSADGTADEGRFTVVLDNFEGPFDLLLQLIAKHKLDVTEVALSRVTDEFMVYIQAMGPDWDLDQTTEFLVVAATLLDLKAARLLPAAEVEDEADLALLEARDLLFAHLLQYRAFKQIADLFADRLAAEARRHPRTVGLEPHHAELLPEVVITIGPEGFAKLAVKAMQPKPKPQVYVDHIHAPLVSVREQASIVIARLRARGAASFQQLVEDAPDTLTVVARFLALLELYRERVITLEQGEALGPLLVGWCGDETEDPLITDEFDQEPGERDGAEAEATREKEGSDDGDGG